MDPALLNTASAFGLAASAGLNTTLPLLCVGLLARFSLLTLAPPYDALASPLALIVLGILAAVEFMGDKVPAVDSVVHAVQWPLAAVAGAILFASRTSAITHLAPEVALFAGLLAAAGVHGARAASRPVVTGTTLGTGNAAVSLAEDVFSLVLAGTSVLYPAVGLLLLALLFIAIALVTLVAIRTGRRLRRRLSLGR
jgi:hypothetical protein